MGAELTAKKNKKKEENYMSGLGVFLSALLGGTKVVGRAIENKKMKDYSYKINEKGQATWLDFDGNQYVNGEKLVPKLERKPDGQLYRLEVGKNSGKVYVDPYENIMSRMDKENLNRQAMAEKYGRLTYQKYHREYHCSVSTEMTTDKIIICMTYPKDEEGNSLFDESLLEKYDINPYGNSYVEKRNYTTKHIAQKHHSLH